MLHLRLLAIIALASLSTIPFSIAADDKENQDPTMVVTASEEDVPQETEVGSPSATEESEIGSPSAAEEPTGD